MTTWDVAQAFTALCAKGDFETAGERFWDENVVSIEPMDGPMSRCEGVEALRAKAAWWTENNDVHEVRVEGPWPHGVQFAVLFRMDVTPKGGVRTQTDEIGLYTVRDGRIVEERFFYPCA